MMSFTHHAHVGTSTEVFTWAHRQTPMCINTDTLPHGLSHTHRYPPTYRHTPRTAIPAPPAVCHHTHTQSVSHTQRQMSPTDTLTPSQTPPQHYSHPPRGVTHTVSVLHTQCHTHQVSHTQCHTRTQCHTHRYRHPRSPAPLPARLYRTSRLSLHVVTERPDPAGSHRARVSQAQPNWAVPSRAVPSRAVPSRAVPSRTGPC